MSFIKKILAMPTVRRAATAFVLAAVPLVIAAVAKDGVKGVTVAVVLAAIIAGAHAAFTAAGQKVQARRASRA